MKKKYAMLQMEDYQGGGGGGEIHKGILEVLQL